MAPFEAMFPMNFPFGPGVKKYQGALPHWILMPIQKRKISVSVPKEQICDSLSA
ncbi:hypothetical protein [Desulfuromonas sp. CSMB_57]|jgi:hypothetical protein|uniref:hypothetical protein n=1 Tax=Desulfuromonas sp. CSMB_57 TaxID=2807629 RepID=UPI0020BF2F48|nr:hypothetical protein [Desulfuromonas sp. CSMB_57]